MTSSRTPPSDSRTAESDEYSRYFEVDRRRIELTLERLTCANLAHLAALDASLARATILSGAPPLSTMIATCDAAASGCAAALSSSFATSGLPVCMRRSLGRTFLVRGQPSQPLQPMAWLTALSCAIISGCDELSNSLVQPPVILHALRNIDAPSRPTWTALARYWRDLASNAHAPEHTALEQAADQPHSDRATKRWQLSLLLPTLRLATALTSQDDYAFSTVVSEELRALRGRPNSDSLLPLLALVHRAGAMGRPLPSAVEALASLDQSLQTKLRPSAHLRLPHDWTSEL